MNTNTAKISNAAIILADVPYNEQNPRQCMGRHYYILISNNACCRNSPVLQAIPTSSNINRRLPVQVEVHAECFSRRTYALAEQLTLLPREIFERGLYCGHLSEESLIALRKAIKLQLSLD